MSLAKLGNSSGRFTRIGVCITQLANVIFFNGLASETISSRAYRRGILGNSKRWKAYAKFIDRLFYLIKKEENHCQNSYNICKAFCEEFLKESDKYR